MYSCTEDEVALREENNLCYIDCTFHYYSQEQAFRPTDCEDIGFDFSVKFIDKDDGYFHVFFRIPDGYSFHSNSNVFVRSFGKDGEIELNDLGDPFREIYNDKYERLTIQTGFSDYEENFREDGFSMTITLAYECDEKNDDDINLGLRKGGGNDCDTECRMHYGPDYYEECMKNCSDRRDIVREG